VQQVCVQDGFSGSDAGQDADIERACSIFSGRSGRGKHFANIAFYGCN